MLFFAAITVQAMPGTSSGGGCDAANPTSVDNQCPDPCSPCGGACGYAANPTVDEVVADCPSWEYDPVLPGCAETTNCYQFEAVATSVSFGVIINSTCTSGNVTYVDWSLYESCSGAAVQTGDLSSLTFTGLTIGVVYTFCYTIQVPDGCYHTLHYPFFVGATEAPLSNDDIIADVSNDNGANVIDWYVSETECDYYVIQRKQDGSLWKNLAKVNSTSSNKYSYQDKTFNKGYNYYRIEQVYNSASVFSDDVVIENITSTKTAIKIYNLNGQEVNITTKGLVIKVYADGTAEKIFNP